MWVFPVYYSVPNNGYVIYTQFPGEAHRSPDLWSPPHVGTPMVLDSASNYFIAASKDCIQDFECADHTAHGGASHGEMIGYTPSSSASFVQNTDMNMLSLKVNVSIYRDTVYLPSQSEQTKVSWIPIHDVGVGAAQNMSGTDSNIFGLGCMRRMEQARQRKLQSANFHLRARSVPSTTSSSSSPAVQGGELSHLRLQYHERQTPPPPPRKTHVWGPPNTNASSTNNSASSSAWGPTVSLSDIHQRPLGVTSHPYYYPNTVTGNFLTHSSGTFSEGTSSSQSSSAVESDASTSCRSSGSSSASYNLGEMLQQQRTRKKSSLSSSSSPPKESPSSGIYQQVPGHEDMDSQWYAGDHHPTAHYPLRRFSRNNERKTADAKHKGTNFLPPNYESPPLSYLEYMYGEASFSPYARMWSTINDVSYQPRETPYLATREIPLDDWTRKADKMEQMRQTEPPLYTVHGVPLRAYATAPGQQDQQNDSVHKEHVFEHALDALLDTVDRSREVWGMHVGRLQNGKQGILYVGERRLHNESRTRRQNVAYIPIPLNFPHNTSYIVELRNLWINRTPFRGTLPRYCIFDTGALHTHLPPVSRSGLQQAGIPVAEDGIVYRSHLQSPHFDIHFEFQNGQTLRLPSPHVKDDNGTYDRIIVTSFDALNTFPMEQGPTMIVGLLWMQHKTIEYDIDDQSISIAPAT